MFRDRSTLLDDNPAQLNYGVAVCDVDGDGRFEFFVAGFGAPNQVWKWDGSRYRNAADSILADAARQAIGVAAGDLDGDGREEIYVLNTDAFAGAKQFADRLFRWEGGVWQDLFLRPDSQPVRDLAAGRSVVALDRFGLGRYGFFVANYGKPLRLYELRDDRLVDVAPRLGLALTTGGRAALALPLVSDRIDLFCANEHSANFLFRNLGDGTFEEVAVEFGLTDADENARGVAVLDADAAGLLDLACGKWEGAHRLFVRQSDGRLRDRASLGMALPSRVRTVIAADFDNDGFEELFFNNIGEPNRLFRQAGGQWVLADAGDALEPDGLGTG